MTTPRTVALLHAVNLGKTRQVPMADLRALCTRLGLADVQTYIQSGNVIFTTPQGTEEGTLRAQLEAALAAAFGFGVPVTLRGAPEWAATVRGCPPDLLNEAVSVAFLAREPDPAAVLALRARNVAPERWIVVRRALYGTVPAGTKHLKLSHAVMERALGVPVTVRNWRTVQAIAERLIRL